MSLRAVPDLPQEPESDQPERRYTSLRQRAKYAAGALAICGSMSTFMLGVGLWRVSQAEGQPREKIDQENIDTRSGKHPTYGEVHDYGQLLVHTGEAGLAASVLVASSILVIPMRLEDEE